MRRGEIVGLDVRDIDFEAGEIHVVHGTDSLGRQKDTKTAASKRALPMPASLKADLRERIAAIEEMFAETRKETGSPWPCLLYTSRIDGCFIRTVDSGLTFSQNGLIWKKRSPGSTMLIEQPSIRG